MSALVLHYADGQLTQTVTYNEQPSGEPRSITLTVAELEPTLGRLFADAPRLKAERDEAVALLRALLTRLAGETP